MKFNDLDEVQQKCLVDRSGILMKEFDAVSDSIFVDTENMEFTEVVRQLDLILEQVAALRRAVIGLKVEVQYFEKIGLNRLHNDSVTTKEG